MRGSRACPVFPDKTHCQWWTFEESAICCATCNPIPCLPPNPRGSVVWMSALVDITAEIGPSTWASRCWYFYWVQWKTHYGAYGGLSSKACLLLPEWVASQNTIRSFLAWHGQCFHWPIGQKGHFSCLSVMRLKISEIVRPSCLSRVTPSALHAED